VDVARNVGAVPVLMTQARLVSRDNTEAERERIRYQLALLTHEALCEAFEQTDQAIHEVARQKGVPVIDASGAFTGTNEFFRDHVHCTNAGSQALARFTAERFAEILAQERKPAAAKPESP
jgi:hypothetical protein